VAAELNEWLLGIDDFPNHHVRVFLVYSPTALWWNCWNADGHVLGSLWITLVVKQDISKSKRCPWVDLTKPDYVEYHDREWGVPVHDDKAIFEFLTLEAAQAGLSWYTVLRKREAYRAAFAGFDPEKVARYGKREIASLLGNEGIIRNQAKILAAINNAKNFWMFKKNSVALTLTSGGLSLASRWCIACARSKTIAPAARSRTL